MRLSKSKFTAGLQCHKQLWWKVHERDAPELVPDPGMQAIFDTGHKVGEAAQRFYPGGKLVEIDFAAKGGIDEALKKTRQYLEAGEHIIYEASFRANDVFVAIDILRKTEAGWVLGEVKSTTRTKPQHVQDAAVQCWVARAAGIDVVRVEIVHLNTEHRHPDVNPLFVADDVTEEVEAFIPTIPHEAERQLAMLRGGLPEVAIGDHCRSPYECPFAGRCWPEVPADHISKLYRLGQRKTRELLDLGHERIPEIPAIYPLRAVNERLRLAVVENRTVVAPGLGPALKRIEGPVAYLDFETVMLALPVWEGCRPYQQVPVQFSVHRRGDAGVEHEAWLAEGPEDPREELAKALIKACAGHPTVFAYFARFEADRIRELAARFPALADELNDLASRLVDMLPLVREHVGHPDFGGSFSLKKVGPALVGSSYADMAVGDGGTAAAKLAQLLLEPETLEEDPVQLRADLLAYCEKDTQVLVDLHDELLRLAASS